MNTTNRLLRLAISLALLLNSLVCFWVSISIVIVSAEMGNYLRILMGVIPFMGAIVLGWLAVKIGEPVLEDEADDIEI